MFSDFKFWLFILSLCQLGLMSYGFVIIKFNDLRHLEKDVKEISTNFKELSCTVNKLDKTLAVQKQRIDDLEKSTK